MFLGFWRMILMNERRMPIPYDTGQQRVERNDMNYVNTNNYNYYGNGKYNDGFADGSTYMDYSNHPNQTYGYGRHNRTHDFITTTRFDPTYNSHNQNLNYGIE